MRTSCTSRMHDSDSSEAVQELDFIGGFLSIQCLSRQHTLPGKLGLIIAFHREIMTLQSGNTGLYYL